MKRGRRLDWLLLVVGCGGFLPLGASSWWGFELTSHFRLQYLAIAALSLLLAIVFRRRLLSLLLITAGAVNAWPLIPYLPAATAPSEAQTLEILTINVNSGNREHDAILALIGSRQFDIVAIQELTPALEMQLAELSTEYAHSFSEPQAGNFGIGVLSPHPVSDAMLFALGDDAAIDTTIETPTGRLRFLAVHLKPPMTPAMAETRNRQLVALGRHLNAIDGPVIVCGDFNLSPYSPYFDAFVQRTGLRDTRLGQGFGISWPGGFPLLGIPIDHCLTRGSFSVHSLERLAPGGSDHYPLRVTLSRQVSQ